MHGPGHAPALRHGSRLRRVRPVAAAGIPRRDAHVRYGQRGRRPARGSGGEGQGDRNERQRKIDIAPFDGSHAQTQRTALKIICRAPDEVASDARGQARETAIAKLIDARIANREARTLYARLGTLTGDAKRRTLADVLHQVNLVQCRYLEEMPPSRPGPDRIQCDAEIEIECPSGYEDGCGGARTDVHACVHVGAKAVTPCAGEVVMRCPAGERSSCFMKPPTGTKHICVLGG